MDQNFQTSFIPKKPLMTEGVKTKQPIGLLTIISFFIFFAMLLSLGGIYFYKNTLSKQVVVMQKNIELAKKRLEDARIDELYILDKRLAGANDILSKHISISPIFLALQDLTKKNVRYTKFSYDFNTEKSDKILVKLSGLTIGYRQIALQADIFAKDDRYKKNIIDPVFSNLSLDDKGGVLFDLEFSVDRSFVDYKRVVLTEEEKVVTPSSVETKTQ